MTVVDASTVVAALLGTGDDGTWAEGVLERDTLAAPSVMHVEVASVLRRASARRSGSVSPDVASLAHRDLLKLQVEVFPYAPFAERIWELRHTVTPYDAWYVAVAEALGAPLATLDHRLTRASGPRCTFVTPSV